MRPPSRLGANRQAVNCTNNCIAGCTALFKTLFRLSPCHQRPPCTPPLHLAAIQVRAKRLAPDELAGLKLRKRKRKAPKMLLTKK